MKRATWADCDSSHQNIWVGTLFWVSRRLHEKLKPRCWKFLSVTREGTGLSGLLWRKQSLDDVTEHWAEVALLFHLGALDSAEGGFTIFAAGCESQFSSWTPQLLNSLLVPDRFPKTESGRLVHFPSHFEFYSLSALMTRLPLCDFGPLCGWPQCGVNSKDMIFPPFPSFIYLL